MNRYLLNHKKWIWQSALALLLLIGVLMISGGAAVQGAEAAWNATYWNNTRLEGTPVLQRTEANIDYDWGDGSPHELVNDDNFSARWTRWVYFEGGNYRFTATMDDGMRVWVNNNLLIDSWWDSQVHSISRDIYLTPGDHHIKVEYYEVGGKAVAKLHWARVDSAPGVIHHWRGEYFNNMTLSGNPVLVRDDWAIDFNWGTGSPAWGVVSSDQFSARWTRTLPLNAGRYRFSVTSDDGARLWVNNQLIIDRWYDRATETFTAEIDLPGGNIPIRLEYYENLGHAEIRLNWTQISSAPAPTPPPAAPSLTATVVTGALNMRSGPGIQHGVVATVGYGYQVALTGYRNAAATWVQVRLADGRQGWMNASYLRSNTPVASLTVIDTPPPPATGQPPAGQTATVVNAYRLNVRSGPGVAHGITTVIARGDVVELVGYRNASATWVKIRLANGVQGWVNAYYLQSSYPFANLTVGGW
jgi:uncharacterized protein YraI